MQIHTRLPLAVAFLLLAAIATPQPQPMHLPMPETLPVLLRHFAADGRGYELRSYPMLPDGTVMIEGAAPLPRDAVLALVTSDQRDPRTRSLIESEFGEVISIQRGNTNWRPGFGMNRTTIHPVQGEHVPVDLDEQPIEIRGLSLSILLNDDSQQDAPRMESMRRLVFEGFTDKLPRIDIPRSLLAGYILSHPDYGACFIASAADRIHQTPLRRRDSPKRADMITGQVTTPDGRPLADTLIRRVGLEFHRAFVLTDAEGRFAVPHRPVNPQDPIFDYFYRIHVRPPSHNELDEAIVQAQTGDDLRVVMNRPGEAVTAMTSAGEERTTHHAHFYRFAFEIDPELLGGRPPHEAVSVKFEGHSGAVRRPLTPEILAHGATLNFRSLSASLGETPLKPTQVSTASHELITFAPVVQEPLTGRVVDARTSEPLAGVMVCYPLSLMDSGLSEEQWQYFENLPLPHRGKELFTRTDEQGRFELAHQRLPEIKFFARGRLPVVVMQPRSGLVIPMLPAASVTVTAFADSPFRDQHSINAGLVIHDDNPAWALALRELPPGAGFITMPQRFPAGQPAQLLVPADIRFWLMLLENSHADLGHVAVSVPELAPGELRDLGEHTLPIKEPFMVVVLTAAGEPVEWLTISVNNRQRKPTDADGRVLFYGLPGDEMEIFGYNPMERGPEQLVPLRKVRLSGEEIELPVFEIRLTDEQLSLVRPVN